MTLNIRALMSSGAVPSDPYFPYVTALLHGDGSNGAQNNTFVDSSPNNFTITRNGNTTQGSFSPYGSNWSNYFDGSGDYLTLGGESAFAFGTGDFTIEGWLFYQPTGDLQLFIDFRPSGVDGINPLLYIDTSGNLIYFTSGAPRITGGSLTANTWNHFAVSRSGTSTRLFINGTQSGSTYSDGNNYVVGASRPAIGSSGYNIGTLPFKGYLSNVRVLKGTALYTSNFTPSTTPLTAISGTSLLTCQSNRFRDGSTNNFTITPNGDVKVTSFGPFAPSAEPYSASVEGGSVSFDGNGDYLLNSNGLLQLSGDFTIDGWFYSQSGSNGVIVRDDQNSWSENGFTISTYSGFAVAHNSTWTTASGTNLGQWNHFAVVKQSGVIKIFLNGNYIKDMSVSGTVNASVNTYIGSYKGTGEFFNGYMSDLRIVNGSVLSQYTGTGTYTIPTSPVTAVSGTTLLLKGANAGIVDLSRKNNLETVGNAQISTSVKKFGTGSIAFDGASDYLNVPTTNTLNLGAGNCTVESWVYFNSTANSPHICEIATSVSTRGVIYQAGGKMRLYANGSDRIVGTTTVTTGTWYHVAVVSVSGVYTLYVDGTSQGTYSGTVFPNADSVLHIGFQPFDNNAADSLNGYIDEFRITKGIARYTANFTPPSRAFPDK